MSAEVDEKVPKKDAGEGSSPSLQEQVGQALIEDISSGPRSKRRDSEQLDVVSSNSTQNSGSEKPENEQSSLLPAAQKTASASSTDERSNFQAIPKTNDSTKLQRSFNSDLENGAYSLAKNPAPDSTTQNLNNRPRADYLDVPNLASGESQMKLRSKDGPLNDTSSARTQQESFGKGDSYSKTMGENVAEAYRNISKDTYKDSYGISETTRREDYFNSKMLQKNAYDEGIISGKIQAPETNKIDLNRVDRNVHMSAADAISLKSFQPDFQSFEQVGKPGKIIEAYDYKRQMQDISYKEMAGKAEPAYREFTNFNKEFGNKYGEAGGSIAAGAISGEKIKEAIAYGNSDRIMNQSIDKAAFADKLSNGGFAEKLNPGSIAEKYSNFDRVDRFGATGSELSNKLKEQGSFGSDIQKMISNPEGHPGDNGKFSQARDVNSVFNPNGNQIGGKDFDGAIKHPEQLKDSLRGEQGAPRPEQSLRTDPRTESSSKPEPSQPYRSEPSSPKPELPRYEGQQPRVDSKQDYNNQPRVEQNKAEQIKEYARNQQANIEQHRAPELKTAHNEQEAQKAQIAQTAKLEEAKIREVAAQANLHAQNKIDSGALSNVLTGKVEVQAGKELNRATINEQGSAVSLRALTEAAAKSNLPVESQNKNPANAATESATRTQQQQAKLELATQTSISQAQNTQNKDILTGKVTAAEAAASTHTGKPNTPGSMSANEAAASTLRSQLDARNINNNPNVTPRPESVTTPGGNRVPQSDRIPQGITPTTRGDIPGGSKPISNNPNAVAGIAAVRLGETSGARVIGARGMRLDGSGDRRYLTGAEIGLLIAAAGIAKSRFDARKNAQKDQAAIIAARNGKDYVINNLNARNLFGIADSARKFPGREITLSAVLAVTGATKLRDIDHAGMRSTENTMRIVRTVGRKPENKVNFGVAVLQNQSQETGGDDSTKFDSQLLTLLPAAPAILRTRRKNDAELEDEKKEAKDKQDEEEENYNNKTPIPIPRYRRTHQIQVGESLTSIAESKLKDVNLAWLIADINSSRVMEYGIDGKRVVEIRSGQKLELPLPHEIYEFYKRRDNIADPDNLVTIVVNTELDREHIADSLNDVLGLRRKTP